MKIAFFDCFSGASGDMILGSLLDAGLSLEDLRAGVAKIGLSGFRIEARPVMRRGIAATHAQVVLDEHDHHHRGISDIRRIIETSSLPHEWKSRSLAVFTRLADAEARAHRIDVEQVHFHEVGAMDAIVDVTAAIAGIGLLGIDRIYCSPVNVGSGMIQSAHGLLPVPAPAVVELMKGRPVYAGDTARELLTPTGAALLSTLTHEFGRMPPMRPEAVGYGAGSADTPTPNVLRLIVGQALDDSPTIRERVAIMETNIDDMNPQVYDYVMRALFDAGARDVFLTPVYMKKNRPGTMLSVICDEADVPAHADIILRETTSIGVRIRIEERITANRTFETVLTEFGPVRLKVSEVGGAPVSVTPEYEDCARIAGTLGVPLKSVIESARAAYRLQTEKKEQ